MEMIDGEVLATLQDDILRPSVVERAVALVLDELSHLRAEARHAAQAAAQAAFDEEFAALTAALARGGDVETMARLVSRVQALHGTRVALMWGGRRAGGAASWRRLAG